MARKRKKVRIPHDGGKFKPGNQVAVGSTSNGASSPVAQRRAFLVQTLIAKANEIDPKSGKENYYAIVDKLWSLALAAEGSLEAIKFIWERIEGKMVQAVALTDEDGKPYEFSLKIGHASPDGSKSAAEIRLRPSVAVSEAVDGDI